jgi:hypothetical protein
LYVIPVLSILAASYCSSGQYLDTRCKENQPTFQELIVIEQQTARTDVGGGTSTAEPWDDEPSKYGNK